LDKVTVGSTAYDLQDTKAQGDISDLKSAVNSGVLILNKELTWNSGYVNSSGVVKSSSVSKFAIVDMLAGETVNIGTANSNICIIGSTDADSLSIDDTVTVIQKTKTISTFQSFSYKAENDIRLVLSVKFSDYSCEFTKTSDIITAIEEDISSINSTIQSYPDYIPSGLTDGYTVGHVVSNGTFNAQGALLNNSARIRTAFIPFKAGDMISITNGTLMHGCGMWQGSISFSTIKRNDQSWVTHDEEITPDYDGYIIIVFKNENGTDLSVSDFDGEIRLYNTLAYRVSAATGDTVPDYYLADAYLANKAARINELGKAGDDVFVFITDIHWGLNAKHSPALIRYLNDRCAIHKIFNGGDVSDSSAVTVYKKYRRAIDGKTYHIAGNHDWFSPSDGADLYYCMDSINNDQIGEPFGHYYFVDNVQQKIRYIILNTFSRDEGSTTLNVGYDADQITWFSTTALELPSDEWDVLVFTHYLRTTSVVSGGADIESAIASFNADQTHAGKILAVIQGHTHWDAVYHTVSGVPVITTTCDKWDLSNESNTIPEEGIAYRESGSIKEQAFDVMILNRASKTITAVRIGAPAQDNIDKYRTADGFTWIGTLEERTVSYGS
jgi:UDP-2,3-diacylglucosamine pyrophosphatase LpxH